MADGRGKAGAGAHQQHEQPSDERDGGERA
jgi:hypothetical protein